MKQPKRIIFTAAILILALSSIYGPDCYAASNKGKKNKALDENGKAVTNITNNLGGGYKGLKWGMSPDEVEGLLPDSLDFPYQIYPGYSRAEEPRLPTLFVGGESRLEFVFYDNQLAFVEYWPSRDGRGRPKEALSAMISKYGKPKEIREGYSWGSNTKWHTWRDKETKIVLETDEHSNVALYYSSNKLMDAYSRKLKAIKKAKDEVNIKSYEEKF